MSDWKVGDIAVIRRGGIWDRSAGLMIEILRVESGLVDFKFCNEDCGDWAILTEELRKLTKLDKALK